MSDNIQISIVLPIYNVEKYLDECVQSVLNQSYANFELILVDDGSTDGSQMLCEQYKKKDKRIVVIHQKNGGLSSARNTGIKCAHGKYITLIDSDDYVAYDYIEKLYDAIVENSADISMCDFQKVAEGSKLKEIKIPYQIKNKHLIFDKEETIKEVYNEKFHGIDFVSWAKMYKLELFRTNSIYFPEGKLHEDAFTTYKLFYLSEKIAYIDEPLYFYRIRNGSITSTFSIKRLDMIQATREEYRFFEGAGNYELMKLAFVDHLHKVKFILKMLNGASTDTRQISKNVCKDLDKDLEECRKHISILKYIYYKGLAKFPKVFMLIW
ncbi:glycosyltransferase family 2 protein [Enterocloster bolteae]|jgi:glycosyltransferase involved in cell wall biosynthesis|uniref:glycosyltransferase family 2 protein n=1 Tax=Enterocloster bolteae TaxID=208479 RepID=UPI0021091ECB|nr:glycosyltransferase [Enterocloster bolteae]MCQ5146274.1 glycosyltransferase [Enterocloster bolteae]